MLPSATIYKVEWKQGNVTFDNATAMPSGVTVSDDTKSITIAGGTSEINTAIAVKVTATDFTGTHAVATASCTVR